MNRAKCEGLAEYLCSEEEVETILALGWLEKETIDKIVRDLKLKDVSARGLRNAWRACMSTPDSVDSGGV